MGATVVKVVRGFKYCGAGAEKEKADEGVTAVSRVG